MDFPAAGVWLAIVAAAFVGRTDWKVVPASLKGALFLLTLVTCASLMPVDTLPAASWQTKAAVFSSSSVTTGGSPTSKNHVPKSG